MQQDNITQQSIQEYEANMPPEILQIIKSFDWKKEVRTIVNQNQLMIDVGADLEETIYLMLLGIVHSEDLYNRLIDVHEIPEDKTRKIFGEIEAQIFEPMYKKISEIPDEEKLDESKEIHRDEILREIEKEEKPLITFNFSQNKEEAIQNTVEETKPGVTKPFTVSTNTTVQVEPQKIEAPEPIKVENAKPLEDALKAPTIAQTKSYSVDPYREPIE